MISRKLGKEISAIGKKMPVITIVGPRQSGKTTLAKATFPQHDFVSLENPQNRQFAQNDPQGFLANYTRGLIIDEAQYAPDLFSYIQVIVDEQKKNGQFILTGSQNFLMSNKISQSLAGRVSIQTLLSFSMDELKGTTYASENFETCLFKGFYPRIYDQGLDPSKWLSDYVRTYVERDVRQVLNVGDLGLFQSFLTLCAGRVGQIINHSSLANEVGVSHKTIQRWFSILEASYIVFFLRPYHKNFNKRIIKSPKLYFYDTGLAAYLLGIKKEDELQAHFAKGALFENLVIIELMKKYTNQGERPPFYFWRESNSTEVDLIIDKGLENIAIEIKSGKTIREDFFKGLLLWQKISDISPENCYVVYGGEMNQKRTNLNIVSWEKLSANRKFYPD